MYTNFKDVTKLGHQKIQIRIVVSFIKKKKISFKSKYIIHCLTEILEAVKINILGTPFK